MRGRRSSDKVTLNGEFNVRWFKVKLEGGVEYVRQTRANGHVAVTVKLPTSGGIGPPLAEALKMGGELDGTVKAGQTPQVTFVLGGAAAADRFERQLTDSAIAIAAGPVGSRILGQSVDIDVPPVESVAYELIGGGNASIGVDSPGGYGKGSIDLGQALGIRKNLTSSKPNSGDITAYYRLDGRLAGEGGLLVGEGGGGSPAGDQTLAATFAADGTPKSLTLIARGSYEASCSSRACRRPWAPSTGSTSRPPRVRARRSSCSSTCPWTTPRSATLRSRSCGGSTRSPETPPTRRSRRPSSRRPS